MNRADDLLRSSGALVMPRMQREREQSLNQISQHAWRSFLDEFICQNQLHTNPDSVPTHLLKNQSSLPFSSTTFPSLFRTSKIILLQFLLSTHAHQVHRADNRGVEFLNMRRAFVSHVPAGLQAELHQRCDDELVHVTRHQLPLALFAQNLRYLWSEVKKTKKE